MSSLKISRGTSRPSLHLALLTGAALVALSACDRNSTTGAASRPASVSGSSAMAETDRGGGSYAQRGGGADFARTGSGGGRTYARDQAPREETPMFHGEPMWSESRTHSAKENAEYHFERAGADLGAKTLDDFLTKVHHFCDQPPAGTLRIDRSNGDRLLYDPKDNLFAVATKDGAPRTVFKPSNGLSYWNEQKAREESRADNTGGNGGYGRRSYRRSGSDDGQGSSGSAYGERRSAGGYGGDRSGGGTG